MEQQAITQKEKVMWVRIGSFVAAVLLLALAAPIIIGAATTGAGLLAILVMGLVGVGIFQSLPLLGQKLENKLLSMRKKEARENPIEQLQNFFIKKRMSVNEFKRAVGAIGAQIKGLADMVAERKRANPNANVSDKEQSIVAMKQAHAALVRKYENAEQALVQLEEKIEEKKFDWKFAQAGGQAIAAINASSGEELVQQMLADEAFDSIRDNFNQVFADLELEAAKLNGAQQLSFGNGMTLDLTAIHINEPQLVGR